MKAISLGILALTCAVSAAAQSAGLPVGTWTQASQGQELVLLPKVKLSPNVDISTGTSLGGSVGYGSMTRTEIVTEPTPLDVAREMTLEIRPGGDFTWVTVKRHADGSDCMRTVRQEKHGRARLANSKLVLEIGGGAERFEKSCGGSGSSALAAGTESYEIRLEQGRMVLRNGPAAWTLTRS